MNDFNMNVEHLKVQELSKEIIVSCTTEKQASKLFELLKYNGYRWINNATLNNSKTEWNFYGGNTVYYLYPNKKVQYGTVPFMKNYISFKNFCEQYVEGCKNNHSEITLKDALTTLSENLYEKIKECDNKDSKKSQGKAEAYTDAYKMFADLLTNPVKFTQQTRAELEKKYLKVRDIIVRKGDDRQILVTQLPTASQNRTYGIFLDTMQPVLIEGAFTKVGHADIKTSHIKMCKEEKDEDLEYPEW